MSRRLGFPCAIHGPKISKLTKIKSWQYDFRELRFTTCPDGWASPVLSMGPKSQNRQKSSYGRIISEWQCDSLSLRNCLSSPSLPLSLFLNPSCAPCPLPPFPVPHLTLQRKNNNNCMRMCTIIFQVRTALQARRDREHPYVHT